MENGLLRIRIHGHPNKGELLQCLAEVQTLEAQLPVVPDRITDLSGAESWDVGFADIWDVVQQRKAQSFRNCFKSAIVAGTSLQQGYARMFQTLNDHPQITLAVFSDAASAEAWLTAH